MIDFTDRQRKRRIERAARMLLKKELGFTNMEAFKKATAKTLAALATPLTLPPVEIPEFKIPSFELPTEEESAFNNAEACAEELALCSTEERRKQAAIDRRKRRFPDALSSHQSTETRIDTGVLQFVLKSISDQSPETSRKTRRKR